MSSRASILLKVAAYDIGGDGTEAAPIMIPLLTRHAESTGPLTLDWVLCLSPTDYVS